MAVKLLVTNEQMIRLCRIVEDSNDGSSIYDVVDHFDEVQDVEIVRPIDVRVVCDYLLTFLNEQAAVEFKLKWL